MKKQKLTLSESFKFFGKALKISLKARGIASILVSLLGFAMAFLPVLISMAIKRFADDVQVLFGMGEGAIASAISVFIILSVMYVVQLLWNALRSAFETRDSIRIQMFMKERVLRCTCDVKYKYIENYDDFRKRINFVSTDAGERVASSVGKSISFLQNIITFITIITVLWSVDALIVLILLVACIPAIVLAYFFSEEEYNNRGFWILEFLMSCAYFFEATMLDSMNEVRFFGAYPWLKSKYNAMNDKYISVKNKVTRKHIFFNSIADIFRSCVYIFILLIAARQIFSNPEVGIGAFMLVFNMASQLQDVTAQIFVTAAQFISDASYMKDYFYLDELEYELREKDSKPRERFDIEFNNVNFTYPNTEREILHNLNLRIREGEKVAIVGENGSGKTTFVSLLCALYEPNSGTITMGGENIYKHLSKTRKTLSAVFQDFARYETSIRENIVVSDSSLNMSDQQLDELAVRTGAWEFIQSQPNGIDEVVGSFSPTGNNLSGGQWQKVALTRCAYRENAKIMVLDEPTAALDPIAEAELYRNFTGLTGERTTILISHRLGITQLVDRILVFDEGRIVEDGDHRTLLSKGGLYSRMYRAQAQWYE